MASHRELMIDWDMLDNDCNNWTVQDLQLAAELGRTVLERNEELETELKEQQVVVDDQAQEIEFLTKQVTSLKEESGNRSKIYEQLESSLCDLEKTNCQLSRKHEVDKKRIQSLGENIEYLERKCEELNVTLQSLKNDQGVGRDRDRGRRMNRNSYFGFGSSDSSEEENNNMFPGYGLFRKRSHSLQDLRDYTPSPDEFDSGNSNSPDLKTSESEFIDSLENRIEELTNSRNKENDKVRQLEGQVKLLVQENANLHQQILQLSHEKEEKVTELRRYLQDSSSGSGLNLNTSFFHPHALTSSTRRNSETSSTPGRRDSELFHESSEITSLSSSLPKNASSFFAPRITSSGTICRRCAGEIQLLNLVNSIENDGNLYDWEFGGADEDMEFSSLEHELAKATGTPYNSRRGDHSRDNRYAEEGFGSITEESGTRTSFECYQDPEGSRDSASSTPVTATRKERNGADSGDVDLDALDFGSSSTEIFNIFFGDKETGESETRPHSPTRVRFSDVGIGTENEGQSGEVSSGSEDGEERRMDEDPCLIKDRKPETWKKLGNNKAKVKRGVAPPTAEDDSPRETVRNPKFLSLPKRIHSESECEQETFSVGESQKDLEATREVGVAQKESLELEANSSILLNCQNFDDPDSEGNISDCSEASESEITTIGDISVSSSTSVISLPDLTSLSGSLSCEEGPRNSKSPSVPEYKTILTSLFSIFNNSKRKYPIPMYPFIQEARRHTGGGLITRHSHTQVNHH